MSTNNIRLPCTYTSYHRPNEFNPQIYFEEFPYFEQYDSNKLYTQESFQYDYGYGLLTYRYHHYIIDVDNETLNYVVVEEEISKDDIEKLQPYCQCKMCTAAWYNIFKFIYCRCCIGCLWSSFPQQWQINKARELYNKTVL